MLYSTLKIHPFVLFILLFEFSKIKKTKIEKHIPKILASTRSVVSALRLSSGLQMYP